MAEDVWSGIMEGLQAARADSQQDEENRQAAADALARQIALQHTQQLEQAGLLIRKQQADVADARQQATNAYNEGRLGVLQDDERRKQAADTQKAADNAARIKGSMDRQLARLDDKGRDRVKQEADFFMMQGLDPDQATQRAIANEMTRGQGFNVPLGQQVKPGTIKIDPSTMPGAGQAQAPQGAAPAGPMGPQPPQPLAGSDVMNQLLMPPPGQQATPDATPPAAAGAAPAGVGSDTPAGAPLPMVAARMGQMQANAGLANAHAHYFDSQSNANDVLTPLKANHIQNMDDYLKYHQMETQYFHDAITRHWQMQAQAKKAYDDASLAIRQNELNGRADQKPFAEFRALAAAKAQLRSSLNGMSKQLDQMSKERLTMDALYNSPRPDQNTDPNGARQWDLIQKVWPRRKPDMEIRMQEMQTRFDEGVQDLNQYRGMLLSKTNVQNDDGTVNKTQTKQLQGAANKAAQPAPAGKGLPGMAPRKPAAAPGSVTIGGKSYTTQQLQGLSPEAAQRLLDQYNREHPGGR